MVNMKNNRFFNKINSISILLLLFFVVILSSCKKDGSNTKTGKVAVIHSDSYVTDNGILYDDKKNLNYKCYYDFESMKNLYFCTRPNCIHSSIDCTSKQNHPYSFFIVNDQYYINTQMGIKKDSKQELVTYLYKSDIKNSEPKAVAKLDGNIISDMYLANNQLYTLISRPNYVNGMVSSVNYQLYQIDMKDYSIKKIFLHEGINNDYIPSGFIDNKMIIYHRYNEKTVNPADYGLKGDMREFIKDTANYKKYMDAVMKAFHEEMFYVDLDTGKLFSLDLPTPLLFHDNFYYYNKRTPEGSYQLIAYNFITKAETKIFDGPVKTLSVIGDTLFLKEGIEKISALTFQPTIDYDKNNCKEYSYDLITGKQKEIVDHLPEKAEMDLIADYGDYYIFFYSNMDEGINQRVGYILKKDYYNGKDKYTLVKPI